jgi:hypothetical protein
MRNNVPIKYYPVFYCVRLTQSRAQFFFEIYSDFLHDFISLFVGWYLDQRLIMAQITNKGAIKYGMGFLKGYIFILRYVAPLAILAIFLYGLLS